MRRLAPAVYLVTGMLIGGLAMSFSADANQPNMQAALGALNARELRIIEERRLSDEGATLEALGETLGISKERVRQIEARAMEKLKVALVKQNPEFLATAA